MEYEAAGVREYWLIDPVRQQAEFYRLGDNDRYHTVAPDTIGIYQSEVIPGFWLKVEWLFRDPPPAAITCLKDKGNFFLNCTYLRCSLFSGSGYNIN
ncbi:hypothetical protein MOOR_09130 [Moorella thermoacetica]|uniref:Putative restriction endonuclease domain-containing protein n=1 Tax=Neomoorella thermoacetica TaxID=1525 RepID=A0A1J5JVP9_NEOTH|nr:hypothetical protein MOOR_09130 [Moorella thermoacetica]